MSFATFMLQGRILDIYKELSEKLDAGKTANHLYERGSLNTQELQEIQRLSGDRSTRAAAKLLDFLLTQTEDFYNCFLDCLTKTAQLDVRQWIVLEGWFVLCKFILHI